MRRRIYNIKGESKVWLDDIVPSGWFLSPQQAQEAAPLLTEEMQAKCDARLSHSWGLTKTSFTELHNYSKSTENIARYEPLFDKVIAQYGDKIEKVKRSTQEVYKWRQQPE